MIKTIITSRHFKAHETLQDYIKAGIDNLNKYNEDIIQAEVILSYEKAVNSIKICEIIIRLKSKTLTAKEDSEEFNKSFDKTLNKIETQLLKYKDKIKSEKYKTEKEVIKTI